ncbi:MAG: Ig-like domain-containing protein [Candidatus Woesearchaeota archaeon]
MLDQAILNYIKQNLASGYTDDQVRQGLLSAGFDQLTIEQAFDQIKQESSQGQGYDQAQAYPQQNQSQQQVQQTGQQDNQNPAEQQSQGPNKPSIFTSSNFKLVFVGMAAITVFFLIAGLMLVLVPRDTTGAETSTGESDDLSGSDDDFHDFPGDDTGEGPADDARDTSGLPGSDNDTGGDYPDSDDLMDNSSSSLDCRLGISTRKVVVNVGQNRGLIAHGNQGEDIDVRWMVEDESIATVNPSSSRYTVVTGRSEGQTRVTAVDTAVEEDCSYSVLVNIRDD